MNEILKWKIRRNIIIVCILLFLIFLFTIIFSIINISNVNILNNISVGKINVANLTQNDALNLLQQKYDAKKDKTIVLNHNDFSMQISYSDIEATMDISKAVEDAYMVGRKSNIFKNNFDIINTYFNEKNIDIDINIDNKEFNKKALEVEGRLPDVVSEYSYYIDGDKLIINNGKSGVKIDKDKLKEKIIEVISDLNSDNNVIDIPVVEANPAEIDIERISAEVEKSAQDAYITDNPKEIHIEKEGIKFAISDDEIKDLLKEKKDTYEIPLTKTAPSITVADLGEKAFVDTLATFSTSYDASNSNRDNNLRVAAEKLNGTIINPGETFSYNKTIGQRTIAEGFLEAHVYTGNGVALGTGGGICQLSSTLYNSKLFANLEIVERHNHYYQTSYIEAGRDATVSWGTLDFQFKNNREYPIQIIATAGSGTVKVDIMGIKQSDDYNVEIQANILSYIDKDEKMVRNTELAPGEEDVIQEGEEGCVSETYKRLLKNGQIVSEELISTDTYNPLSKITEYNN